MKKTSRLLGLCLPFLLGSSYAFANTTKMLEQPDLSDTHITFIYAQDLWLADRDGKQPKRLVSDNEVQMRPHFSPDGQHIAFTANYGGNNDVYVISVDGGTAKRLTYHPGSDMVEGWSNDGERVVFTSMREVNHNRSPQMFEISVEGGHASKIMEARAVDPVWAADGETVAYRPFHKAHRGASGWRQHRGGTSPPVWIYNTKTHETSEVPKTNSNDFEPMWVGDDVYFLSDRDGSVAIHQYGTSGDVNFVLDTKPWDILSANAHGGEIIFEAGGEILMHDTRTKQTQTLPISIAPDLPQRRVAWKDVSRNVQFVSLSPTGKRAAVTARGEVFTVPLKDGTTRNVSQSDGVREMTAIWSADGSKLAYLSDASGAYRLVLSDQFGNEQDQTFALTDVQTNYFDLVTFADNDTKVVYRDSHLNLKYFDLDKERSYIIGTDPMRKGFVEGSQQISVSPDGKWIAYSLLGPSNNQVLYLYNFDSQKATAITDGMSDAGQPAFSVDGEYLYFSASTNRGPSVASIDMSQQDRPYRTALYAAVLSSEGKSPLLPKSDEEVLTDAAAKEDDETESEESTRIDLDGIMQRIVALPVAEKNYSSLRAGHDGALYFIENPQPGSGFAPSGQIADKSTLMRFDMEEKKASQIADDVTAFVISHDAKTMLFASSNGQYQTAEVGAKLEPKPLNTSEMKLRIDPAKEWAQIFEDTWRMQVDYFYAENMHGLDMQEVYKQYRPLLDHVGTRGDLNKLIVEMIAELQVGHNRAYGGDMYQPERVNVGLLGADISFEDSAFRLAKIYTGENWNPFLDAPLGIPGVDINEGDYILAVNGKRFAENDNFFAAFENTAGKQVTLLVSDNPRGRNAKEVTVVPTNSEFQARLWSWIEGNRKYVDEQSDGQVGYVYVPNTADAGFTFFNRMFFSQLDKKAVIIDERSNGGGQIANYITDVLSSTYLAGFKDRDGKVYGSPVGALDGPKVMLIDQDAGSGGDFLPYAFKHEGIGKLIGTRTWGGLIGISHNPSFIDGGQMSVPFIRIFDANNEWLAENTGIAPDIEVKLMPGDVNKGKDAQLDRGIAHMLEELETFTPVRPTQSPKIPTELGL
ncbi:PD40 domain-containing protein [Glaciecola sp. XM2]|jgi:tricorn protease|uniref:S41 family peptidase n=1 Tax=Glaciecola sp. XM2 TaxID=1914931 RepID=UPI001BDE7947|nr:S41 family peptidase [Glaciecola sp. XM2]MBT1450916.1 PD40 domain-containing protein [Glaciecola sp. XM2]